MFLSKLPFIRDFPASHVWSQEGMPNETTEVTFWSFGAIETPALGTLMAIPRFSNWLVPKGTRPPGTKVLTGKEFPSLNSRLRVADPRLIPIIQMPPSHSMKFYENYRLETTCICGEGWIHCKINQNSGLIFRRVLARRDLSLPSVHGAI